MDKNINLLPCPFCGSFEIKVMPRYNEITGSVYGYKVECSECYTNLFNENKYKAIKKWNTRKYKIIND